MKTHTITVTVTAPNRLSASDVASIIERLVWIGKEDAADSLNRGGFEDHLQAAKDAMSLRLKFDKPHPLVRVLKEIVNDLEDDQDWQCALRRANSALEDQS